MLGRLRPGVPLSRANAAVEVIASRLAREHTTTDPDAKAWLLKQALAETSVLAGFGSAAGLLVGFWASRLLEAIRVSTGNGPPVSFDFSFDGHVFLYAVFGAILAVFLAGVAPAVRAARSNPCEALHEGGRGAGGGRNRFRKVLVIAQIAGSVVLLVMAGRATRSLIAAEHSDLGFNPSHLFMLNLSPSEAGYDQGQSQELYKWLLPRVGALPGVESAALAYSYPSDTSGGFIWGVQAEDRPLPPGQVVPTIGMTYVSPGYFKTMQIPVLRGRPFLETDTANSPQVAVINEAMAGQLWPNGNPIGKRFSMSGPAGPWIEVAGVAADSTYTTVSSKPTPYFYLVVMGHALPRIEGVNRANARDPVTYLAAAILISAATLLACYIPARRAAKVDPVVALRSE